MTSEETSLRQPVTSGESDDEMYDSEESEKGGSYLEECTRQFSAKFGAGLSQRGPNKLVEI